jgi:hypothetical protein
MERPDFWRKLEIILSPVGGLLTALSVALLGFFGSAYLNRKQESDTQARVYAELNSFLKPETASLDEKVLNMELLAYNFHETLDLKPLFSYLERQIASGTNNSVKNAYQQRLTSVARNIARSQMIVLEEDGQKSDRSITLSALADNPGGVYLDPAIMSLDGIQRSVLLIVTGVDKIAQELHCRLVVNRLGAEDTTFKEFSLGFYDFPMIDNTRLTHDQRCAVVLNNLAKDSADVTLVLFPGSRASLKEKTFYEDVIDNLQKIRNSQKRPTPTKE